MIQLFVFFFVIAEVFFGCLDGPIDINYCKHIPVKQGGKINHTNTSTNQCFFVTASRNKKSVAFNTCPRRTGRGFYEKELGSYFEDYPS